MDDVPLSNVTERDPSYGTSRTQTADFKETQVHDGSRGRPRAMSKVSLWASVICHLILVTFTFYIIILCFYDSYSLFLWHPSLMTIGAFLLMAEAVMAMSQDNPLSGKFGRSLRVQMHWILQALAASFIFIGFLIIVVNKNLHNKNHFHSWHAIYGLITVIMVGMASTGGVAALYSIRIKQFIRPALIKLIHNIAGIVTYIFGAITMILAMYSGWFTTRDSYSYATQVICIFLIVVSTISTLQNAVRAAYTRLVQTCQRH